MELCGCLWVWMMVVCMWVMVLEVCGCGGLWHIMHIVLCLGMLVQRGVWRVCVVWCPLYRHAVGLCRRGELVVYRGKWSILEVLLCRYVLRGRVRDSFVM